MQAFCCGRDSVGDLVGDLVRDSMRVFGAVLFAALAIALSVGPSSSWAEQALESDQAQARAQAQAMDAGTTYPALLAPTTPLGLPGQRPKLTLSMPLTGRLLGLDQGSDFGSNEEGSADQSDQFSWSLRAWQLNTASLAHIQCSQHTMTLDSFVAQNCQFVDQPIPNNAVNLVQIQGEWTAAPNVQVGVGLFQSQRSDDNLSDQLGQNMDQLAGLFGLPSATPATPAGTVDGAMANVSFGIDLEKVGDFLVGLQLARYRQRSSLMDLGDPRDWAAAGRFDEQITNAAALNLAWQRGNFRGDLMGRYVDRPLRLGEVGNQTITAPPSGFDLEFSWQPGSASFSVGVSNVLDQGVNANGTGKEASANEGVRDIYGRIPYVRYKQDL